MTDTRSGLRIAYLAPHALHDPSSGAALSLLTMLRALAARGWDCRSLSPSIFDRPPAEQDLPRLAGQWGLQARGTVRGTRAPLWEGRSDGVEHSVVHLGAMRRLQLNPLQESVFLQLARKWLAQVRPDIVLTMGGLVLDGALQRAAKRQGAAVVFYLANGSYGSTETFSEIDQVITNSDLTARMYAQRLGIRARNVGVFVDSRRFVAERREPRFVTFINPVAEKGVALFLRLVAMARTHAPEMRFLVVQSRGTLDAAVQRLGLDPAITEHVTVLPRQDDMRQVYGSTRVLLFPSMWFEAAGRALIEALANGIPVLATNRGGIPETLAGGGTLLDVPQASLTDHWHMPSEEEAQPWWQALSELHACPERHEAASRRALDAGRSHDLASKAASLDSLLREIALARPGMNPATLQPLLTPHPVHP